jgi:hypothetical protein
VSDAATMTNVQILLLLISNVSLLLATGALIRNAHCYLTGAIEARARACSICSASTAGADEPQELRI